VQYVFVNSLINFDFEEKLDDFLSTTPGSSFENEIIRLESNNINQNFNHIDHMFKRCKSQRQRDNYILEQIKYHLKKFNCLNNKNFNKKLEDLHDFGILILCKTGGEAR